MWVFPPPFCAQLVNRRLWLAGWREQDAAEQTSLFLPHIEGALIKAGNPRRAAKVLLRAQRSLPLGTATGPASPATEHSQSAPMPLPVVCPGDPCPSCAVRAALQKAQWDLGQQGQLLPGKHPLSSGMLQPTPVGCSSEGGFWDEQLCKKKMLLNFF